MHGQDFRKGFIAQEVEQVFPEAVGNTTECIPDIYKFSSFTRYDSATKVLVVGMDSASGLVVGDVVRIIMANNHQKDVKVLSVEGKAFSVANWDEKQEKVFGKEIHDFRAVDYSRIFTLGISAIQELARKQDALHTQAAEAGRMQAQLGELQQQLEALRAEVAALKK